MPEPNPTLLLLQILVLTLAFTLGWHLARGGDFPSRPKEMTHVE